MANERHDAHYIVAVSHDGLVLARQVTVAAMSLPETGQPLIAYLGDDPASRADAAAGALALLIAHEQSTTMGRTRAPLRDRPLAGRHPTAAAPSFKARTSCRPADDPCRGGPR